MIGNEPEQVPKPRLMVVSNRLPVILERGDGGEWQARPGSGGLVTALAPVLKNRGGLWIGWPGITEVPVEELESALTEATLASGFNLKPVELTQAEKKKYYHGSANEMIWPLFHDMLDRCNFDPSYWPIYQQVNRKFAEKIIENIESGDFIWVHDYHLMDVANELRSLGFKDKVAFFLHIPFPSPDIFMRLPWRFDLLRALLAYDLIGLQTMRDQRNFIQCVRKNIKTVSVRGRGHVLTLDFGEWKVRVGAFPISIDYHDFASSAGRTEVANKAWYIHEQMSQVQILLGIDRLDYSKGIPERLKAYKYALSNYPELREKIILVQVVVPSRRNIPEYEDLKTEIERLVSEINGEFTRFDWVPIHYVFRSLTHTELLAYYRTSEIALVTPLKDGMNLIAKEFCASSIEENCVLILSEFAGAAAQLQKNALMVNPHDQQGVAEAIFRAFKMPLPERRERMRQLRKTIERTDVYWWVNAFLQASFAKTLNNFSRPEDYRPQIEL